MVSLKLMYIYNALKQFPDFPWPYVPAKIKDAKYW